MAETHFGKFSKDGRTKFASSAGEAVSLRYQGWAEEAAPTPAAVKSMPEPQADEVKAKK